MGLSSYAERGLFGLSSVGFTGRRGDKTLNPQGNCPAIQMGFQPAAAFSIQVNPMNPHEPCVWVLLLATEATLLVRPSLVCLGPSMWAPGPTQSARQVPVAAVILGAQYLQRGAFPPDMLFVRVFLG